MLYTTHFKTFATQEKNFLAKNQTSSVYKGSMSSYIIAIEYTLNTMQKYYLKVCTISSQLLLQVLNVRYGQKHNIFQKEQLRS